MSAGNSQPQTPPSGEDTPSTPAAELEKLTARLIGHIRNYDFSHPELDRHVAPNFTAYVEYSKEPAVTSRDQLWQRYREIIDGSPGYRSEIESISADVDDLKGTATVWLNMKVITDEAQRHSVTVMYWERVRGNWRCIMQDGIRGIDVDN